MTRLRIWSSPQSAARVTRTMATARQMVPVVMTTCLTTGGSAGGWVSVMPRTSATPL